MGTMPGTKGRGRGLDLRPPLTPVEKPALLGKAEYRRPAWGWDSQDDSSRERISRGPKGHAGRHGNREAAEPWEKGACVNTGTASPVGLGAC